MNTNEYKRHSAEEVTHAMLFSVPNNNENNITASTELYEQTTELLGEGAFSKVYLGFWKPTNERIAIKVVDKKVLLKKFGAKGLAHQLEEVKILKELENENVIRLYYNEETENEIKLMLEYCDLDLSTYLVEQAQQKRAERLQQLQFQKVATTLLDETEIRYWLRQMAAGLKAFRQKNLVHRDLKPKNLMLKMIPKTHYQSLSAATKRGHALNYTLKIGDLGFARELAEEDLTQTYCGTRDYMAPELLNKGTPYGPKVDLWAVGVIVYQMLVGQRPFKLARQTNFSVEQQDFNIAAALQHYRISESLRQLLKGLLSKKAEKRLTFEEFFNHPFLTAESPQVFVAAPLTQGSIGTTSSSSNETDTLSGGTSSNISQKQTTATTTGVPIIQVEPSKSVDEFILVDEQPSRFIEPISGLIGRYADSKMFSFSVQEPGKLLILISNEDHQRYIFYAQPFTAIIKKKSTKHNYENCKISNIVSTIDKELIIREDETPCKVEICLETDASYSDFLVQYTSQIPFKIQVFNEKEMSDTEQNGLL